MKRLALLLVLVAACDVDNALVGGRCRSGFHQDGASCVADPTHAPSDTLPPAADAGTTPFSDASVDVQVDSGGDSPIHDGLETLAPLPELCDDALVACNGTCISVADDGQNCGACGKICPSNICIAGECQGAMAGDVVLVGHDFSGAWNGSAQAKILVNAVSIPTTNPIRVLSYEDGADPTAVDQARSLMTDGVSGRSVEITQATKASLDSMTLDLSYDVVVLHDAGDAALGDRWKDSLPHFAQKGGVIVALDGGASHMSDLVASAKLLAVAGHTTLPESTHLRVAESGDAIGVQVLSPYAAFGAPVAFTGVESGPDVSFVVRVDDIGAAPVVVHKTVR